MEPWARNSEVVPLSSVRAPSQRPLAPSVTSVTSVNVKGDNYMIFGIYLTVEENSSKTHLGDDLIKAVRPVIASNEAPYLQLRSVTSHSTSGGRMEKIKWSERV